VGVPCAPQEVLGKSCVKSEKYINKYAHTHKLNVVRDHKNTPDDKRAREAVNLETATNHNNTPGIPVMFVSQFKPDNKQQWKGKDRRGSEMKGRERRG